MVLLIEKSIATVNTTSLLFVKDLTEGILIKL